MAAVARQAVVPAPSSPFAQHDVATASAATGAAPHHTPPQSLGSSSASPSSSSPTSPTQTTLTAPVRARHDPNQRPVQIRQPKPVGFVPAALRPTEHTRVARQDGKTHGHKSSRSRNGPPTPPQSLHGSTDSLAGSALNNPSRNNSDGTGKAVFNSSPAGRPGPIDTNVRPTSSSRAPSILGSPTTSLSSLSLTSLAAATTSLAPHPTRAHWKPDAMAPTCDAPACPVSFTTFTRRHHCRRCGGVFCHRHANRQVLLDGDARMVATPALSTAGSSSVPGTPRPGGNFGATNWPSDGAVTPEGGEDDVQVRTDVGMWRACESCHAEWLNWTEGLREAAESAAAANDGVGSRMQLPPGLGVAVGGRKTSVAGSIAGSVPRDWSWSTF